MGKRQRHGFIKSQYRVWDYRFFLYIRKNQERDSETDGDGSTCDSHLSYQTQNCDTRFGTAKEFMEEVCDITGNPGIRTLQEAEPIGPKGYLDVMVIAPCTGNSAAKLANAITDTPVLMAAKAHMRNGKPLVIAISTNDALGASFKNIGMLMNTKHIYFVPFAQDNYEKSQIRWWQKWNFCRRRFRQLWKESSCSRWYGDKSPQTDLSGEAFT